jgi:hypothetical protein
MKAPTESKTTASRQNKSKREKKRWKWRLFSITLSLRTSTQIFLHHPWRPYCGDISFSEV